jgi:uncharacterized Fe-S cluster protein YjdI
MADTRSYQSDAIRATYDPKICIHSATCAKGLPAVFNGDATPWVQPQNADAYAVAEQVKRCPSGALQYQFLDRAK